MGLLLDESSYQWFDACGFPSGIKDAGHAMFKCICNILAVNADMEEYDASLIEKDTSLVTEPMEVSHSLPLRFHSSLFD